MCKPHQWELCKAQECGEASTYPKCIPKHEGSREENTHEYKQWEKAFQNQSYLQIRLEIGRGEKTYVREQCDKALVKHGVLQCHTD